MVMTILAGYITENNLLMKQIRRPTMPLEPSGASFSHSVEYGYSFD